MVYDLINFIKDFVKIMFAVCLITGAVILLVLALPNIVEQTASDNQDQPYSGATPDCPYHIDEEPWMPPHQK